MLVYLPLLIWIQKYFNVVTIDLQIGFMWTKSDSIDSTRFSKKDREDLLHEGWNELNLDNYGVYHIQDNRNDVDLAFSVVRQDNDLSIRVEGDNMSVEGNSNSTAAKKETTPVKKTESPAKKTETTPAKKETTKSVTTNTESGGLLQGKNDKHVGATDSIENPQPTAIHDLEFH